MTAKKSSKNSKKTSPPDSENPNDLSDRRLAAVLASFEIKDCDVLIVGDGSGFAWDIGCGWASILIDLSTFQRKLLWGAWMPGTIGIGELIPYLQALMWFHAHGGKDYQKKLGRPLNIHVISDNENVVNQGNGNSDRKELAPLWAAVDTICRKGYNVKYHWMGRDQLGLNILADHVSRCARLAMSGLSLADMVTEMPDMSIYDVNPS